MHMNILAALLTGIKDRQLDSFFQLEENIMKQNKAQILEHIKSEELKGGEDKLRLFIIWYLSSTEQDVTRPEWEGIVKALDEAGADTTCLPYIRQYVAIAANSAFVSSC